MLPGGSSKGCVTATRRTLSPPAAQQLLRVGDRAGWAAGRKRVGAARRLRGQDILGIPLIERLTVDLARAGCAASSRTGRSPSSPVLACPARTRRARAGAAGPRALIGSHPGETTNEHRAQRQRFQRDRVARQARAQGADSSVPRPAQGDELARARSAHIERQAHGMPLAAMLAELLSQRIVRTGKCSSGVKVVPCIFG